MTHFASFVTLRVFVLPVMILGLSSIARAQGTATLFGTVRDTTNAVLPGVTGVVKQTGLITTLASSPRQAQLGVKFVW